ncbi:hypothetical protein, partial [Leuconostoc pseudomesenteroides]|uniref:hypothetical protein n=1 Tax=Leuconostoc pseudomesenteroides TaxID=33968 RepID=UPI0032DE96B3
YSLVQQRKNQSCQSKNKSCLISSALDKKHSELLTYEQCEVLKLIIREMIDIKIDMQIVVIINTYITFSLAGYLVVISTYCLN